MKLGGKYVGKGKGGKADPSQYGQYTPGIFTPAGRKSGSSKSSSKAHSTYNSAMKHKV